MQKTPKDILEPDRISGAFFRKPTVLFQMFRFTAQKVKDNFQCEIILGNNRINQEKEAEGCIDTNHMKEKKRRSRNIAIITNPGTWLNLWI